MKLSEIIAARYEYVERHGYTITDAEPIGERGMLIKFHDGGELFARNYGYAFFAGNSVKRATAESVAFGTASRRDNYTRGIVG